MSFFDSAERAYRRLDETRASVRWAKAIDRSGGSPAERRASNEIRAASFVAVCGAMEQFFREFVERLCSEIAQSGTRLEDVRLSLHSIASADDFRSLQNLRKPEHMFVRRMDLLQRTVSTEVCALQVRPDELGLGGETMRPERVNTVWAIFGLPGSGFGHDRQADAMRVFADNRNDYAHGRVDVTTFLDNPECQPDSILNRMMDIEDWCYYCADTGDQYLASESYRRSSSLSWWEVQAAHAAG